jgi:hypothetical protein
MTRPVRRIIRASIEKRTPVHNRNRRPTQYRYALRGMKYSINGCGGVRRRYSLTSMMICRKYGKERQQLRLSNLYSLPMWRRSYDIR